ncbi:MAG: NADH-quinone oxidoreductase subunit [Gaiellales bacterium]|jgi:NADH-quinone oxidoreductase subunit C|nr:NADH-quinone oxidoreductase subunit [Gaiellales bacterium]
MTAEELSAAVETAAPGAVVSHEDALDMPTLTVRPEQLVKVCEALRDQHGKNFLSAVTAVDYLGYGEDVAGYFGTERGRDLNATGSWGSPETAPPPPTRFSVKYHMAHIGTGPIDRLRVQVFVEDGEEVPSVVSVWPTADWHEREQYDLMGIVFAGHPNLQRLIMPSDWDGHPLRKDYPIGGEPVQFTDAK